MTRLLEDAIDSLRRLPEPMQDSAARAILQLGEDPEPGDREAIEEGRREFARGDFVTFGRSRS